MLLKDQSQRELGQEKWDNGGILLHDPVKGLKLTDNSKTIQTTWFY